MGCWKWFNKVLKETGVEVTDASEEKVEEIIKFWVIFIKNIIYRYFGSPPSPKGSLPSYKKIVLYLK